MAKEPKPKRQKADPAALQSELRAFASQLGFASGGNDGGFNDSDFRPDRAKQSIAASDGKSLGKSARSEPSHGGSQQHQNYRNERRGNNTNRPVQSYNKDRKQDQNHRNDQRQQDSRGGARFGQNRADGGAPRDQRQPYGQRQNSRGYQAKGAQGYNNRDSNQEPDNQEAKGRTWNFGAGPRPGDKLGKSILDKDEASLWYEAAAALPKPTSNKLETDDAVIEQKRHHAEQLLETEVVLFETMLQRRSPADARWLQTVRRTGTTADKVAAASLVLK